MKNRAIYYVDGQTTVCLLRENDTFIARGISVCSKSDHFDGAEGRRFAHNRALETKGRQRDCGEIKLDEPRIAWFDVISLSLAKDRFGGYKGYYLPELTPTEKIVIELKN